MVFKSTLLLSFALVQMALAATTVTIVNPKPKQVWHAGQVVEFKWISKATETPATSNNNNTTSTITKQKAKQQDGMVSIALATGPSQSLVIDRVIASNINITKGSYKWKIPKNINTTKKYVIEIGPNASDIAFAGYISIIKAPSTNSTTSPSGKPTKTVPPPSSSSSSSSHGKKPTHTSKHEPSSVCVVVPNKNGQGSTVKCHPQPSHKKSQKQNKTSLKKSSSSPVVKTTQPPIMVATPSA